MDRPGLGIGMYELYLVARDDRLVHLLGVGFESMYQECMIVHELTESGAHHALVIKLWIFG